MIIYENLIVKILEIRGSYGYLDLRLAYTPTTVFYAAKGSITYKIVEHIKTNGDGSRRYKISRCDEQINEEDLAILVKGRKVHILNTPAITKPGYTL